MSRHVLVMTELRSGTLRQVSYEALTAARKLAEGGDIIAAVFGRDLPDVTAELQRYGANNVLYVDHEQLKDYTTDAYLEAWTYVIKEKNPSVILAPHTAIGKDVSPRVASRLGLGLISDCTDVELLNGRIVFTRPIYAGKAFVKKTFREESRVFATLRPNNISAEEASDARAATVDKVSVDISPKSLRTVVEDIVQKTSSGVDLSEARIVVAGGRGVKSAEGFNVLQELADVLGGAVGASRGACDAGYCDYALQIGQTGKVVTPDLYIACGISGAIQHLAGMSNSKVIVAINKDPEANIFKVADYGIVGDLFEVVPKLTEAFKKTLSSV